VSINFVYLNAKIIKYTFEKYPINIAGVNSIKTYNQDTSILTSNDYMFRLFTDDLYFNLTIGTPPQIVPTIWNMEKYSFKFYNESFYKNNSSTFINISSTFRYSFDESCNAIMCEDLFHFTDVNNNSFSNIISFTKFEEGEKNYSFVGLQLPNYIADGLLTFIRSLKQYEVINNYIFFIYYNEYQNNNDIDNYNGNLYFGEYPHNMKQFNNIFKENNFYEINAGYRSSSSLIYWDILFHNIYFSNAINENAMKYKQAELLGNMRLSVGTDEYKDFISEKFFDEYINKGICQLKTILNDTDYMYYECKNDEKIFDISKFPTLKFEIKDLNINMNFSLNYKDLFFVHNDYIYFSIVFDKFFKLRFQQRWRLGSVLFRKYLLTFNQDNKKIGIYKNVIRNNMDDEGGIIIDGDDGGDNDSHDTKKNGDDTGGSSIFIKIVIIVGLLALIAIIGVIFVKNSQNCFKKNQQKNSSVAHDSKNKNEIHEYYELGNNLME
jgi:hypothetical protein